MRLPIFGIRRSVFRWIAFNGATWQITSGRWECLVHVALVQKFITIADLPMVLKVAQSQMRTAILRSGTSSSCRTFAAKAAARIVTQFSVNFLQRTSILALAWSAWLPFFKVLKIFTRSTQRCRFSIEQLSSPEQSTELIKNLM